MSRGALAARQQQVLGALLRGDVPDGFDARSARLTTHALVVKRRSDALAAVPALAGVPDLRERFAAWAVTRPRTGCAHQDVVDFVVDTDGPLPEPFASVRAVERVYRRRARVARDRRPGCRRWAVAVASHVRHVGPRNPEDRPPFS
jgi:hypothetical protein